MGRCSNSLVNKALRGFGWFHDLVTMVLVMGLGVAAIDDYYNHKITPLLTWRALMIIETGLVGAGLVLSSILFYRIGHSHSPPTSESATLHKDRLSVVDKASSQKFKCRLECLLGRFQFYSVLLGCSTIALAHVIFLYNYTNDEDSGAQTEMDKGWPTGAGDWSFVFQRKNDLMTILQVQLLVAFAFMISTGVKWRAGKLY